MKKNLHLALVVPIIFSLNTARCAEQKGESRYPKSHSNSEGYERNQPVKDPKIVKHPDGSVSYPSYNSKGNFSGMNWRPPSKPERRTGADNHR